MEKKDIKIIVLGAGISGLAAAYWLNKEGYSIQILETKSEPGGAMQTSVEDGYLVDYGPNSGLETTPLIAQLVEEIGLKEQMIYANEQANKRYILRNNNLHELPTNPKAFLKTKLFSIRAKLRLAAEPLVGKSKDGYYQSMSQFVRRRLGKEFLDYAIDPFVSGVFAGDPAKLSVKSAFPKLYRLEEVYGGLFKGMFKGAKERRIKAQHSEHSKQDAKMFSFINGMQSFPKAIAEKLSDKIDYNCKIQKVEKTGKGYRVYYRQNEENKFADTHILISAIPSHVSSKVFEGYDDALAKHLDEIYYPPVMMLYIGYKKAKIGRALDGFGYLIPSKEKRIFLGAIWSSTIFPNRAPEDSASFTLFVGGARAPHLFEMDRNTLIVKVIEEFNSIMDIKEQPDFIKDKLWSKAIPQYNVGYIEHENYFEEFETKNPGIFLSGNYRGGISVGDCIKNSDAVFNRVKDYVNL